MGQQERDAFPFERLGRLEERVDGHDREFDAVRALIHEMSAEAKAGRVEMKAEQERTREFFGSKIDEVVREQTGTKVETAGLREVATSTRLDLRGFKRIVVGAVSSLFLALVLERLIGG